MKKPKQWNQLQPLRNFTKFRSDREQRRGNQLDEIASTQNEENQETVVNQATKNEPIEHEMNLILQRFCFQLMHPKMFLALS